jgi:hypothetical protein
MRTQTNTFYISPQEVTISPIKLKLISTLFRLNPNLTIIFSENYIASQEEIQIQKQQEYIELIKNSNKEYLHLPENITKFYKIKLNAIYFPQYHEIPENNDFWGDGFTEWSLLKPYENNIKITNDDDIITQCTLKPHDDIGYYNLDNINTLKKQIEIAEKYDINGFIIYHYWFSKDKKVMYKPLEYFLREDITFPFCISWANESWSRRWDGNGNEILIEQKYDSYKEHIEYLIPFFKKSNYMKNNNKCLFYIYNFADIVNFDEMEKIWKEELLKHDLDIDFIITENSFDKNHNINKPYTKFIFEPLHSFAYCRGYQNKTESDHNILFKYDDIYNKYINNQYNTQNKHLGLPLYWNNIIRRKNLQYAAIIDYDHEKLEDMLIVLICHILSKYKNMDNFSNIEESYININAWNEWNEQAVLEPNNIYGYKNLEIIYKVVQEN